MVGGEVKYCLKQIVYVDDTTAAFPLYPVEEYHDMDGWTTYIYRFRRTEQNKLLDSKW